MNIKEGDWVINTVELYDGWGWLLPVGKKFRVTKVYNQNIKLDYLHPEIDTYQPELRHKSIEEKKFYPLYAIKRFKKLNIINLPNTLIERNLP